MGQKRGKNYSCREQEVHLQVKTKNKTHRFKIMILGILSNAWYVQHSVHIDDS